MNIDYHYIILAFTLILYHVFIYKNRVLLEKMAKGGDQVLSPSEMLVVGGLYFFFLYSFVAISLMMPPDYALLGIFITVAGGGTYASLKKNGKKPDSSPSEGDDESKSIG